MGWNEVAGDEGNEVDQAIDDQLDAVLWLNRNVCMKRLRDALMPRDRFLTPL